MESYRHVKQLILLLTCLERLWSNHSDFFAAINLSVYYSTRQRKSEDVRGPDFFVVLNTERKERKSWVVWQEDGKYPNFVLEVLSDSTAKIDRGLKKQLYQDVWRTPDYFCSLMTVDEGEAQAQAQAQTAQAQAQAERDRAEAAIASIHILRQKLQQLGINPDELEQV